MAKTGRAHTNGTEKTRQVAANGKVGKGKPPEEFKWQPGQSGNPSGRPSAQRQVIVQAVKDMLGQVDPKLNKSLFERLLEQCARRALQGSKWHMGVLFDYGLGKPMQSVVEHSGINLTEAMRKARESVATVEDADRVIKECLSGAQPSMIVPSQEAATPGQDSTASEKQPDFHGPIKRVVM